MHIFLCGRTALVENIAEFRKKISRNRQRYIVLWLIFHKQNCFELNFSAYIPPWNFNCWALCKMQTDPTLMIGGQSIAIDQVTWPTFNQLFKQNTILGTLKIELCCFAEKAITGLTAKGYLCNWSPADLGKQITLQSTVSRQRLNDIGSEYFNIVVS